MKENCSQIFKYWDEGLVKFLIWNALSIFTPEALGEGVYLKDNDDNRLHSDMKKPWVVGDTRFNFKKFAET